MNLINLEQLLCTLKICYNQKLATEPIIENYIKMYTVFF